MKSFFKMVLAAFVGVFVASLVSGIFYTCTFVGIVASMSESETTITKPGDVLVLKINGEVSELPNPMPFNFDIMSGFSMNESLDLQTILKAIDVAEADPNISGIYLNTDGMSASPATYETIHNRFEEFQKSGKWIVAYNDSYTTGQYYLASMADSLFVNTIGSISLDGMSSMTPYFKGFLDKFDINVQIFRVGSFKSAVEPFMLTEMSDANRLQTLRYMSSIWEVMSKDIAAHLGVDVAVIDSLANLGVSFMTPDELATTGLAHGQIYKEEVEGIINQLTGKDKFHGVTAKQLASNYEKTFPGKSSDKIAVIYAVGEIVSDDSSTSSEATIYWPKTIKEIKKAQKDDNVKAVVLRVNSPGGSAFAAEQIWKALTELRDKKPLIVSMGDYAASGGYYISAPADYIIAEPNTLTGSIGVFGIIPEFSGIATKKLGITFQEVKTHQYGQMHTFRPLNSAESAQIQKSVEKTYDLFLTRCADGRDLTKDSVNVIGGGRVWTGKDALEIGLVDALGSLNYAIEYAAKKANLEEGKYTVKSYPEPEPAFASLLNKANEEVTIRIADILMDRKDREAINFIQNLKKTDRIQARSFEKVEL